MSTLKAVTGAVSVFVLCVVVSVVALPQNTLQALNDLDPRAARGLLSKSLSNVVANISDECTWALGNFTSNKYIGKYVDAAGKIPSGFELGNILWMGSYELCQTIPDSHYCMVSVSATLANKTSTPIRWGVCLPDVCSEMDTAFALEDIVKYIFHVKNTIQISTSSSPHSVYCAKPSEYTGSAIGCLFVCAVLCLLCLIGTIVDGLENFSMLPVAATNKNSNFMPTTNGYTASSKEDSCVVNEEQADDKEQLIEEEPDSTPLPIQLVPCEKRGFLSRFFTCFSLIKNTNKIMDTDVPAGAIMSLNGMRVLSMTWVILGHTYLWMLTSGVANNLLTALGITHRFSFQAVNNAFLSVDSFFFLSGLLMAYLGLRQMSKQDGHLPLGKFYLHRFLRLTPTYMFVIWFYVSLDPFLGSGPLWYTHQQGNPTCEKYWWTNLLYINNFHPNDLVQECLGWSWYLANDMQFYAISPILLYLIYRFGNKGLLAGVGGLLVASFVVTGVIIGYYDLPVALAGEIEGGDFARMQKSADYSNLVYVKPYCRISPYLVGIALGYLLHKDKRNTLMQQFKPSARVIFILLGWALAIICGLSSLYGLYKEFRTTPEVFTMTENVIYGVFSRFTWALALAWVIYACHTGIGGLINSILSARFWIPLSRLTYSAYLLHPIVLGAFYSSFQSTMTYTDTLFIFYFVGTVSVAYAAAFVLAVTVEFPTMRLEQLFLKY